MKKLIIMAALAVATFGFTQASAQKVIKDANGLVYIDVQDMAAGTFSNSTLKAISSSPTSSMYKKLLIAKNDINKTMKWYEAVGLDAKYADEHGNNQGLKSTGCSSYTEGGTSGWRVPTDKELAMMYLMKDNLSRAGITFNTNGFYHSSTQRSRTDGADNVALNPSTGLTHMAGYVKDQLYRVRCVREM